MCPSVVFVSTAVRTSDHGIVVVYCGNVAEHVGLCGAKCGNFKADCMCNNHCGLKQWYLNCDDLQGFRKYFFCILNSQNIISIILIYIFSFTRTFVHNWRWVCVQCKSPEVCFQCNSPEVFVWCKSPDFFCVVKHQKFVCCINHQKFVFGANHQMFVFVVYHQKFFLV